MATDASTLTDTKVSISDDELEELRTQIRGSVLTPSDTEYGDVREVFNAMHGEQARPDRDLLGHRRRGGRGELRPRARHGRGGPRRRTLDRRPLLDRRRHADRPGADERRDRRPRARRRARAGWRALGRRRSRGAGLRPRDAGRRRVGDRCRRAHTGRRLRLGPAQVRAVGRQPASRRRSSVRTVQVRRRPPTRTPTSSGRSAVAAATSASSRRSGSGFTSLARSSPSPATLYPVEEVADVLRRWREYVTQAPDEVTSVCVTITFPADPALPEVVHDRAVAIIGGVYVGDVERA